MIPAIENTIVTPFISTSFIELLKQFKTDEDCMEYLYNLKFSKGFVCSKCNNNTSYIGMKPYTQVCRSCRNIKSATSGTLFHKVKFGLLKAFMITYEMTVTTKGMSARAISLKYDINKDSAWLFMKKVRTAMASTEQYPMVGKVYVDEYVIGGYEKDAVGRKADSKKVKLVMAVEVTENNRIKRMYSMKLANYSTEQLRTIFEKHISKEATVLTDGWKSYNPLKADWNIIQDSKIKNNSPVNRMIQQNKSWLRGIYHNVSEYHCMDYLNEFSFRINRSQWKASIFHKCIERMVNRDNKNRLQLSQVKCQSREQFVSKIKQYELWNIKYEVRGGKVKMVA